jgi:hypothetical protein
MRRKTGIFWLGALAAASAAGAAKPKLPPYPEALRCASLTQAWTKQVEIASDEGSRRFDKAMFWSLAAAEAGRKGGLAAARIEADQAAGTEAARAELARSDPAAGTELAACVARVPPLKP